jgi:hypothetical protein
MREEGLFIKALYSSCDYDKRKCTLYAKVWRLMVESCDTGTGIFVTNRGTHFVTQDIVAFLPISKYKVSETLKKDTYLDFEITVHSHIVNRTIQHWNQFPAEVLETLPCKQITFKKRVRKAIIEVS